MARNHRFMIAVLASAASVALAYYILPWFDLWLWLGLGAIPLLAVYAARLTKEELLERLADQQGRASGFCSYCDEPASLGPCPGCGRSLSEKDIRDTPRGPLGRHRKKLIAATSLFLLGGGGYYAYEHANWQPYLSTERLLDLQAKGSSKVVSELDRRFLARQLSEAQEERFLRQAIKVELKMRDPYPAEVNIGPEVFINFMIARIGAGRQYVMRDYKIFIDDSLEPAHAGVGPSWSGQRFGGRWKLWAPRLEAGMHTIRVAGTLTITSATKDEEIDEKAVVTSRFEASLRAKIVDKPATEFVRAVHDAELGTAMKPLIGIRTEVHSNNDPETGKPRNRLRLVVNSGGIPEFIAAIVEVRPSGTSSYKRIGACHLGPWQYAGFWLDEKLQLGSFETIDVRLKADAMEAVYGCPLDSNEYYGGDVERVEVWGAGNQVPIDDYGPRVRRPR